MCKFIIPFKLCTRVDCALKLSHVKIIVERTKRKPMILSMCKIRHSYSWLISSLQHSAGPSNDGVNEWSDDGNDDFLDDLMDGVESAVLCGNADKRSNGDTLVAGKQKKARLDLVGDASVFTRVGSSFNNIITWYYKKNTKNIFNYSYFLNLIKTELLDILKSADPPIKFNLKLEATYYRPHVENSFVNRAFKTSARAIFAHCNIEKLIDHMFMNILTEEEVYQDKGSGFSLQNIDGLLLGLYSYTPLGGSSYIPLPSDITNKKAVINPKNNTNEQCFKWASGRY